MKSRNHYASVYTSQDPFARIAVNVLIAHCFNTNLNLAWTIELVNVLKLRKKEIAVLDLSEKNLCNETQLRYFWWRLITKRSSENSHNLRNWLDRHQVKYRKKPGREIKRLVFSIKVVLFLGWRWNPTTSLFDPNFDSLARSVHSSISNALGTAFYHPLFHPIKLLRRVLAYFSAYYFMRDFLLHNPQYQGVYIPNGRLPVSAGAAQAAQDIGLIVRYVERGGSPGMLDIFTYSPHSMKERREAVIRNWELGHSLFPQLCDRIAKNYFELRRNADPFSGVSWQKDSYQTEIELFGLEHSKNKLWGYFTSTELEFAVHQEVSSNDYFQSQTAAIEALVRVAKKEGAQLVIRRHPQKKWRLLDAERTMWRSIRNEKHVTWIGPKNSINSYKLGSKMDVIFHYNSSMGPEMLALNHRNITTLGPTPWLPPSSFKSCGSEDMMKVSIASTEEIEMHATKWALYQVLIGSIFSEVEWRNGKGQLKEFYEDESNKKILNNA